jgi:hypothetical protein
VHNYPASLDDIAKDAAMVLTSRGVLFSISDRDRDNPARLPFFHVRKGACYESRRSKKSRHGRYVSLPEVQLRSAGRHRMRLRQTLRRSQLLR